ncbi:hypothetical protein TNCV_844011 [Trichonephila clavipes]|nr:hypothetical protein TNCV_844011 [Trichonephila clavipes]
MSGLGTKRDRDKRRKWESLAANRKWKAGRIVSNQGLLRISFASGTESKNQINWFHRTSQQHLSVSESPLNLEVTPDAPTINTE